MPLGDLDFGVSYENHTSYPAPGQPRDAWTFEHEIRPFGEKW